MASTVAGGRSARRASLCSANHRSSLCQSRLTSAAGGGRVDARALRVDGGGVVRGFAAAAALGRGDFLAATAGRGAFVVLAGFFLAARALRAGFLVFGAVLVTGFLRAFL